MPADTRRVFGSLLVVVLLVLAVPGSVYLVQHQYQLRTLAGDANICTVETCGTDDAKWRAGWQAVNAPETIHVEDKPDSESNIIQNIVTTAVTQNQLQMSKMSSMPI